jgi:dihydrofolate reductase
MGSRTWLDPKMPKPLVGRTVYVASSKPTYYAQQIEGDFIEQVLAIEQAHKDKTIWVIGGPKLIEECTDLYDHIYLTHFKGSYKVDTKIDTKKLLTGFIPVRATVASDFKSTLVKYASIFKRRRASS